MPVQFTRRQFTGSAAALATIAALPRAAQAQAALAPFELRWPQLVALMRGYVVPGKVPNMVAGLGWGAYTPDFFALGNTSFSSAVPADENSLYRIYSMTKPITGMAAMMCIDDGLLTLDTPLAEIYPGFAQVQVQKVYDGPITPDNLEPAVRPVTVRHCLTHTAGLGYSVVQQGPLATAYDNAGLSPAQVSRLELPGTFRAPAVRNLQTFAERLATMPLVYQPGTRWSYSVGLDLLGAVIEKVSGKAFDSFLQERIFDPCDMTSTAFRVGVADVGRLTANYSLIDGTLVPIDLPESSVYLDEPAFPFGGSGLASTSRDYDRFLTMLANGGEIDGRRVMDAQSVAIGTSDLFPDTMAADGRFQFGSRTFGYGAGGLVGTGDAEGLYGWFGAAGTCGLVNIKLGLRHNLMTQYMPAQAYPLQNDFPVAVAADAMAQSSRG
ncbi:MAG: serine hydrolase domain-containing protein [Pseudomonadota bacterium]